MDRPERYLGARSPARNTRQLAAGSRFLLQCRPAPAQLSQPRIIARRGKETKNIAKAAARKLLTLTYYGLRDGQIRALSAAAAHTLPATPSLTRRHDLATGPAAGARPGCVARPAYVLSRSHAWADAQCD
jgi:hypothetical protein